MCIATFLIDIAPQHRYIALQQTRGQSMDSLPHGKAESHDPLIIDIDVVATKKDSKGANLMGNTAEKTKSFTAEVSSKAGAAVEKGKAIAAKGYEFQKANVEAVVESGKIAVTGTQDMGKTNIDYAKSNFSELQAAVKDMTAVKTPTDLMKLQGEYAKKSMETAVDQASKNTEAMVKLMGDIFQPISARMAATTDLVKKAA